ncbi:phosphatidate cytidylyltransferase [Cochlodiniinecator piscidefendens]|uniref:phosphatidate cytidylyltransferase n=1 Tax=Cochlodiniinecator piscidefendens TaxID=2715756 RepID=UPI00140B36CD|nr:phosphatidate cytidylyltransferase [Cochlodiniinecator piscidefendens]
MNNQWADLMPRIGSAIVMAIVGLGAVFAGGLWFTVLVSVLAGLMVWELLRMLDDDAFAVGFGLLSGALIFVACLLQHSFPTSGEASFMQARLPGVFSVIVLALAVFLVSKASDERKKILTYYSAAILIACFGLYYIRQSMGVQAIFFIILVVVATDIAGYFVGRIVGGPKFWPAISPKKTWSGTAGGWIAASIVALLVGPPIGVFWAILSGVVLSFGSQLGDVVESAIKRKTGVKDSSNLIPGHGGVLDRFDGMIGATLLFTVMVVALNVALLV